MTKIQTAQVTPHHYRPSWLHMGDCDICGHVAESPLHLARPVTISNPAPSPGPLWDATAADSYAAFVDRTLAALAVGAGLSYEEIGARLAPLPEIDRSARPAQNPRTDIAKDGK